MAERVLQATVTLPTQVSHSNDVTVALPIGDWDIEAIDLEVPPGPAGVMGFYLANNGVPWIPRTSGEYIVWDDHSERFHATNYPTGGGWQVVGHNNGDNDHVVVVRFHVNAIPSPAALPAPYIITFVEHDISPTAPFVL